MTKFKDPDHRQPAIIVYYLSINIVICNLHCNSSMYMPIGIARNTACSCHFYSKHLLSFVLLKKGKKSTFSVTLYACTPKDENENSFTTLGVCIHHDLVL